MTATSLMMPNTSWNVTIPGFRTRRLASAGCPSNPSTCRDGRKRSWRATRRPSCCPGRVHDAHSTFAELADDSVIANDFAGWELRLRSLQEGRLASPIASRPRQTASWPCRNTAAFRSRAVEEWDLASRRFNISTRSAEESLRLGEHRLAFATDLCRDRLQPFAYGL